MEDETVVPELVEEQFPEGPQPTEVVEEGKPVGPATVVQDDPIEQFPVHEENV